MTLVSVALPVRHAARTLERAVQCISAQTHNDIEILLVLNGSDDATQSLAQQLALREPRIKVISLPDANLAHALNVALREARGELVARMDADDACPPERLARQAAFMLEHVQFAALASAFEVIDADTGRVLAVTRPPTDPAELRWRLLTQNGLCHGSMMLRRDAILAIGGYDENRLRAQDYELWLRLSGLTGRGTHRGASARIACLPDVLYQYHVTPTGAYSSSPLQASVAAELIVDAWRALPRGDEDDLAVLLADALGEADGPGEALQSIDGLLRESPSMSALLGWLWTKWSFPAMPARAVEACRRSRLREVGARLQREGVREITLWGAGSHAGWVLSHSSDLGLPIRALVDDHLAGQQRHCYSVGSPATLRSGDTVLISSDWHEDELWEHSRPARERGVRVVRLYMD